MDQILSQLIELQQKPAPFTPGEALFWDDPHISSQMLAVHLNPDVEAASRRPETTTQEGDLTGVPRSSGSEWIGIIAQKR